MPLSSHQFLIVIAAAVLSRAAYGQPSLLPLKVGQITIDAAPLFDEAEAASGSFYRAANLLQVPTRTALLRRFLLFREGDTYDPTELAETERNLRLFGFLTSVSVIASPPHDGVVDVSVLTHDAWTTVVSGDYSDEGGKAAHDIDITQHDLFGSASELQVRLDEGVERRSRAIEFLHPAAFGPYWSLDALYSKNSDGNEEALSVIRPQYSYTTPWTAGVLLDHTLRNERYYRQGEVAARFRQEHREVLAYRTHVLRASQNSSDSVAVGIDFLDDSFSTLAGRPLDVLPDARHYRFFDAGFDSIAYRYIKLNYVDNDLREQDFNLGHSRSIHLALSPGYGHQRATWRLRASEAAGRAFSARSFVTGQVSVTSRAPHDRNTMISADARLVNRFDTRFPQALVARLRIDAGSQLDRDVQVFADGQSGLRAYPDFAFEGSRRVLLNLEHRIFLGRELLHLFGPSIAGFVDSGQAFDHEFRVRRMKTDAGIGLRIGIARFESALIRIDYSWAFNSSLLNRAGPVLSISTVHAF